MVALDETDLHILKILQNEGRISNANLARQIELSPPATLARTKRLEEAGIIRGFVALLEPEQVGFDMLCFVNVSLQLHQSQQVEGFERAVAEMPEVLECHHVTGEYDYLLKVAIRNRSDLKRFAVERLTPIPGVARIYTSLVLSEVKSTTALPLQ